MHRQVLLRDIAGDGHGIEDFHEQVVNFYIEALHDFIAEGESLSHVARLVIASQKDNVLREVQFYREKEDAHLNALNASVNVVAQEEIVKTAWLARLRNHVQQVSVLSMDVTHHADRLFDLN
jgi:hypothetical protein